MTPSPCINLCRMDPAQQFCLGCWRTLNEITQWSRCDEAGRLAILAAVHARRQAQGETPGKGQNPTH